MQAFGRPIIENQFLGYNDRLPAQDLRAGEFAQLINVRISNGKIQKSTGTSSVAPQIVNQSAVGLAVLESVAAGTKYIVAAMNGASHSAWYQWAGSGNFALISGSNVMTNSFDFFFETAVDTLFGFSGKDVGMWDGTTFTHNPTSVPKGYYPVWFHNYLFVARTDGFPNRLYWSALGQPSQFAGGISTVTVNAGGYGYSVGDVIEVNGGTGSGAVLGVTSVSSGAVTGLTVVTEGAGYTVQNGIPTQEQNTVATGVGLVINVTAIDTSTVNQFIDINPGDGDEITGLGILNDELFVFKRNSIWAITGFSGTSFSVATVNAENTNNRIYGYGCISAGSIVATGDDIYFLSFLGDTPHIRSLVKTQYATTVEGGIITENISGTMGSLANTALNTTQAIYDGRYIKWALPGGGASVPNFIIELDTYQITRVKGETIYPFVQRVGINPQFFVLSTISGTADVYFIDSLNSGPYQQGICYKFDSTINTDLNVQNQIAVEVVTRGYMPDPARKFKWKYLYIRFDSGQISTFDVNSSVDFGNSVNQAEFDLNTGDGDRLDSFVLDASVLGSSGNLIESQRVNLAGMTGKVLQLTFFESSNAPFGIYDWELYSVPKPLRWN